jgi:UPF0755 protein
MPDPLETVAVRQRRRRRIPGALIAVAVAVALVAALGVTIWAILFRAQTDVPPGRQVTVEIPRGADTARIADRLARAGVIPNALMFRLRTRLTAEDARFKAGEYRLATGMDYSAVVAALEEGPAEVVFTVPIPEGFTVDQIAERLQARARIPAAEFRELASKHAAEFVAGHPFLQTNHTPSLEGYLFPKTYRIKRGTSARAAVEMMLDQFGKETEGVSLTYANARGLDLHQVVTMASMIEREARVRKDRPLIASVIYNRLRLGMRLQIDATVQYVLGNKPRLLTRDLKVNSPYNTYIRKGLPPGPIANPGLSSLKAAAKPAETDYIYYVLTGADGSHTFTTNAKDFEAAKRRAKGQR